MINFLKRNVKLTVVTGIALLIIAGLTTALVVTNTGPSRDRTRPGRNVAMAADRGERDPSMAADRGDKAEREPRGERTPLTEEERAERHAERLALARDRLDQKLADGSITQEQYDEALERLENNEFPRGGRGGRGSREGRGGCGDPDCERTLKREAKDAA